LTYNKIYVQFFVQLSGELLSDGLGEETLMGAAQPQEPCNFKPSWTQPRYEVQAVSSLEKNLWFQSSFEEWKWESRTLATPPLLQDIVVNVFLRKFLFNPVQLSPLMSYSRVINLLSIPQFNDVLSVSFSTNPGPGF